MVYIKQKMFVKELAFLSNFHICSIFWDGEHWPSVEHAYQAAKTTNVYHREEIQNAPTHSKAKYIGRKVWLRKDWENIKISIMEEIVVCKFVQNKVLKNKLIQTKEMILVEINLK